MSTRPGGYEGGKDQTMTKKQIENLSWWFATQVRLYHDNGEMLTEAIHRLQDFLRTGYDMHLYEYKEVDRVRKIVLDAGIKELEKIKAA